MIVDFENRSLDIPYADSFYVKEKWTVISDTPESHKCVMRASIHIIFVKSTLFKGRILSKTEEGMKLNID